MGNKQTNLSWNYKQSLRKLYESSSRIHYIYLQFLSELGSKSSDFRIIQGILSYGITELAKGLDLKLYEFTRAYPSFILKNDLKIIADFSKKFKEKNQIIKGLSRDSDEQYRLEFAEILRRTDDFKIFGHFLKERIIELKHNNDGIFTWIFVKFYKLFCIFSFQF